MIQSVSAGANTTYPITASVAGGSIGVVTSGPTLSGGTDGAAGGSTGFVYALDVGTDPSGTVFSANDSVNGNWSYFYDNLNRLQQASTSTTGYTYDYDRYGNRLHQTPLNGGNGLSLVYVNNQISATGVTYDASGNMTSDGTHTYAYDAANRLISVDNGQTATYTYNAEGQRVRSTANGTSIDFVYDLSGQAVGVLRPDGTLIRQEIGGLATYSDKAYFHHRDWLGNLRVVTDQTGSIQQTCTNLPYGDGLTCTSAGITPTHFTGYMRDSETNLDFANARYYTSQYGRFMSVDPLGGAPSNPQSLNPYSYVRNGPLSATDPSGMSPDCPGDWCVLGPSFVGINLIANTRSFQSGGFNGWSFGSFFLHLGGLAAIGSDHIGGIPGFSGIGLCGIISGCGKNFGDAGSPKPSAAQLAAEADFNAALGAVKSDLASIAMSPPQMVMAGIGPKGPPILDTLQWLLMRPLAGNAWIPVGRAVGVAPQGVLDLKNGYGCLGLGVGPGARKGGFNAGPLFGDIEHAPELINGVSISVQGQTGIKGLDSRIPAGGQAIWGKPAFAPQLYGPTWGSPGFSMTAGYSHCWRF